MREEMRRFGRVSSAMQQVSDICSSAMQQVSDICLGVRGKIQHGDAGIESATSEAQGWMRSPGEQQISL